jgi:hypothetical protein
MNVYLLVTGMYEGYTVLGVYTEAADAQRVADAINANDTDPESSYITNDARVEAYPLNPSRDDMLRTRFWVDCRCSSVVRVRCAKAGKCLESSLPIPAAS